MNLPEGESEGLSAGQQRGPGTRGPTKTRWHRREGAQSTGLCRSRCAADPPGPTRCDDLTEVTRDLTMQRVRSVEMREMVKSELIYHGLRVSRKVGAPREPQSRENRGGAGRGAQPRRLAATRGGGGQMGPGPAPAPSHIGSWVLGKRSGLFPLPKATWVPRCAGPVAPSGACTCAALALPA